MNAQEFNQWWADFKLRFPDMGGAWFAEGRTPDAQKQILETWLDVLSDVLLGEALTANKAIQLGDVEGFTGKWDRDTIATRIRTHAIARRTPRSNWTGPNDGDELRVPESSPVSLGGIYRAVLSMSGKGATRDSILAYIQNQFPPAPAWQRQPAFSCLDCLDNGRVEVWHEVNVQLAAQGKWRTIATSSWRTMLAACNCERGAPFRQRRLQPLPEYRDNRHCKVTAGDTQSDRALTDLRDWLDTAMSVQSRKNYVPAFNEWNP